MHFWIGVFVKVRQLPHIQGFFTSRTTALDRFPFSIPISIHSRRLRDIAIGVFWGTRKYNSMRDVHEEVRGRILPCVYGLVGSWYRASSPAFWRSELVWKGHNTRDLDWAWRWRTHSRNHNTSVLPFYPRVPSCSDGADGSMRAM
jgi:hypothetical protein